MAFKDELKLHFDARIAVVNVVTSEEARVLQELTELAHASGWPEGEGLYTWDVADQFQCLKPAKVSFDTESEATPDTILGTIDDFALATDFNPGSSPGGSLPLIMALAVSQARMQPEEAFLAATVNAACAVGL